MQALNEFFYSLNGPDSSCRATVSDRCVYRFEWKGHRMDAAVHVDDIISTPSSPEIKEEFERRLRAHFGEDRITGGEPASYVLGMRIDRDRAKKTLTISQGGFIRKLLEKFGIEESRKAKVQPLTAGLRLKTYEGKASKEDTLWFLQLVGNLQWCAITTRPDVAFAAGLLGRHTANPSPEAMAEGEAVAEAEAKAEAQAKEEAKEEAKAEARAAEAAAEAATEAGAADADAPTWTPRLRQPYEAFEAKFGRSAYSWTVCSFHAKTGAAALSNARPVWPDSYDWQTYKWAKLPKQTHLLLFGTSSMGQLGSALRAAAASHGILENTVTVSANRDCDDPTIDPRTRPWPQSMECQKACKKMKLGPSGATCKKCNSGDASCARCRHDPHAITVDHLSGGSTITTIANHGQSQRLHARLDEYLSMVALSQLPNGTMKFTHGAFMNPHTDTWYDARCEFIRAQAREGGSEQGMEEDGQEPEQEYREAHLNEMQPKKLHLLCGPEADAQCPRRHPHFATMAKWVDHEVAAVISPARDEHENTPFVQFASVATGRFRGAFPLHCVTDHQLQARHECPNGRNTTVWLGQSEMVYRNSGAEGNLPSSRDGGGGGEPPCFCEHLCNARCVRGGRCYAGPGLAAAWLVLRAAGLASSNS